jgi:mRNA-degrading endonuclease toxin of MazEF toxin-antitoxin module
MTVVSTRAKRFSDSSPVTRYWLANCAGFEVAGGVHGTVERAITNGTSHVPFQLEIRNGKKVRRLPVDAVTELVPEERVLVVRGTDRHAERTAAVTHTLGKTASGLGVLLLGVAAWLVRAGMATVRLVRSLPWQRYAHSVASGTTRVWREISTTWSLLRTTSSEHSSVSRSSDRARTTSST